MMKQAIRRRDFSHAYRCPKCGSLELYLYPHTLYRFWINKYYVKCDVCEFQGKTAFGKNAAINKWNRRANDE